MEDREKFKKFIAPLIKYILSIIVACLILGFLFTQVPLKDVFSVLKGAKIGFLIWAFILGVLSIILNGLRWTVLLSYLGYRHKAYYISKVVFVALFFNTYLPSGFVGDFARIAILPDKARAEDKKKYFTQITASVITDRLVGFGALMLLAFIGFVFSYSILLASRIFPVFIFMIVMLICAFLVLFSRRVQRLVKKVFGFTLGLISRIRPIVTTVTDALHIYRKNYAVFFKVIPMSILSQLCVIGYFFMLAKAVSVDIGFLRLVAFVPIIELVAAIPISFGGVGIRESATMLLFMSDGILAAQSMTVSLLSFALILALAAGGGIIFVYEHFIAKRLGKLDI